MSRLRTLLTAQPVVLAAFAVGYVLLAKRHEPVPLPDPVIDELDDELDEF